MKQKTFKNKNSNNHEPKNNYPIYNPHNSDPFYLVTVQENYNPKNKTPVQKQQPELQGLPLPLNESEGLFQRTPGIFLIFFENKHINYFILL